VIARWRAAWFAPFPAQPVGLARIGIGLAAMLKGVDMAVELPAIADPAVLKVPYGSWLPTLSPGLAWGLVIAWLVAAIAFTLGAASRWAGSLLTVTVGVVLFADQQTYSNHLYLLWLLVGLLTWADAGAWASLDRGRPRDAVVAAGPVRLLQLELTMVYGLGAVAKLNPSFLSGDVLRSVGPPAWLAPAFGCHWSGVSAVAGLVIALELFLAVGLWGKRSRWVAMACGLGLHLTILWTMGPSLQLLVFGWECVSLYALFAVSGGRVHLPQLRRASS